MPDVQRESTAYNEDEQYNGAEQEDDSIADLGNLSEKSFEDIAGSADGME